MKTETCHPGWTAVCASLVMLAMTPVHAQSTTDPAKLSESPSASSPVEFRSGYPRIRPPAIEELRGDPDIVVVDDVNYPISNSLMAARSTGRPARPVTVMIILVITSTPGVRVATWDSGGGAARIAGPASASTVPLTRYLGKVTPSVRIPHSSARVSPLPRPTAVRPMASMATWVFASTMAARSTTVMST